MMNLKTHAFNPEIYRNLDIEEIISAPLIAATSANGMMAREQVRFLMDFCFNKEGENYKPVMIRTAIVNSIIEPGKEAGDKGVIRRITTSFYLPLLTIIPINSLAVETTSVNFEIELTGQTTKTDSNEGAKSGNPPATPPRPRLLGKVSYDSKERSGQSDKYQNRSSNSSGLKVDIKAGQLPLPPGMTTLLDLYTKSIGPFEQPDKTAEKEG
ncbi:DUF2589 domain-containing protein [Sinomicrobium weinanense]|uniref:DUF2589 domain-containing protein n=1 Tax=Sinomicrobium weinanense TaxID=2842200 RepID=A0A926JSX9_9FLAO|nr:DUF2589 domain-containing protein [Sinomicrobium weinanense]MBC9796774.1 DUF2589 domain-containing protein [Sinomicrobium weinanense]MBU3125539.1 DUF2589 domain-containing protein [Sinomicrobium weinanense]